MGRACSLQRRSKKAYKISDKIPERKRPLGRPRCRWRVNSRMDFEEVGGGGKGEGDD
jgi:hypothetical protein